MRSSIANRRSSSTSLSQPISCTTWRSPNPSLASAPPADPGDAACAVEPTVLSPSCLVCVSPALHAPGVGSTVVGDSGTRHHMHILWTGSRAYSGSVGRVTRRAPAARYEVTDGDQPRVVRRPDTLAVEEPLEIRVDGEPLTVTMRTPGDDIDLAAGFLFTEGLLPRLDAVHEIRMCDDNVAAVTMKPGQESVADRVAANRNFITTSACGVCGKDSIEAIRVRSAFDVAADTVRGSTGKMARL